MSLVEQWFGDRIPIEYHEEAEKELLEWFAGRRTEIFKAEDYNQTHKKNKLKPVPCLNPVGGFCLFFSLRTHSSMLITNEALNKFSKTKMRKVNKLYDCMVMSNPAPNK